MVEDAAIKKYYKQEKNELAGTYQERGVSIGLAHQVAEQLMAHDALGAHLRDELGISENARARPIQAAVYSASAFTLHLPCVFLTMYFQVHVQLIILPSISSLLFRAALGAIAAYMGGAPITTSILRVTLRSALAMQVTAGIGELFNVAL